MDLIGLDLKTAKEVLLYHNIKNYKVLYKNSKEKFGTILSSEVSKSGFLTIYVATNSIINYLPTNFKKNRSLDGFLMIFQHFFSQFEDSLNNIHKNFDPMSTDKKFLYWLSSWFSLDLGADLPEIRYRSLIKEIATLYRWRGTKKGLSTILEIVSGVKPDIAEGASISTSDTSDSVDFYFSESDDSKSDIGINFPISQKVLGKNVVKTIFKIVEKEKPAHLNCRISFSPDVEDNAGNSFEIGESTIGSNLRF